MRLITGTGDDGGTVVSLHMTPEESAVLGEDPADLLAAVGRVLWAAADLRRGVEREEWWPVLLDSTRALAQITGVRDAALREIPHASHAEIAAALGESRTTVATRRQQGRMPPAVPTPWEVWARTGEHREHRED